MWNRRLVSIVILASVLAPPAPAQIRGGAESVTFEPGDIALLDEDYASLPLGDVPPGWTLHHGNVEVAEFQGKHWIRPLSHTSRLDRRLRFPDEFSVEFTTYLFAEAGPWVRLFLSSAGEFRRLGEDGPAEIYLQVMRGYHPDHDNLRLLVWEPERNNFREVLAQGSFKAPAGRPHRVALQVRGGRLSLFFDGTRLAVTPFVLREPLEAITFLWGSGSGSDVPFKDRPALVTDVRVAAYSTPSTKRAVGVGLYLAAEPAAAAKLRAALAAMERQDSGGETEHETGPGGILRDLLRRQGWERANELEVRTTSGRVYQTLLFFQARQAPFVEGEATVRWAVGREGSPEPHLKAAWEAARALPGSALLILGQVAPDEGATEGERALLRRLRSLAVAAWLARRGVGDASSLLDAVARGGPIRGFSIVADNGGYESIYY